MTKRYYILLAAILLLAACEEKVIDIDPSQSESRVVVMSTVEADSAVTIHLTYSRFFLDDRPFQEITNAAVQFAVNGTVPAVDVVQSDGYYSLPYTLHGGDKVDLTVSVPGKGVCTASTTVPAAAVVSAASARGNPENGSYAVRFRLSDDGTTDNYYSVSIRYEYDTLFEPYFDYEGNVAFDTIVGTNSGNAVISCNDYMIADQSSLIGGVLDEDVLSGWELYFTDRNINGLQYEVKVTANMGVSSIYVGDGNSDEWVESRISTPRFYLDVATYSRDRYLYDITSSQYSDDAMLSMFEEPVQIHCNIEGGGIGIFAARNQKTYPVAND